MNCQRLLRERRESSRNTFTVGNGYRPGAIPERAERRETGTSSGYLAPAGGECRRVGRAPASRRDEPGEGPLHLIHGGGLVVYRPIPTLCQDPSAGKHPAPFGKECFRRSGKGQGAGSGLALILVLMLSSQIPSLAAYVPGFPCSLGMFRNPMWCRAITYQSRLKTGLPEFPSSVGVR